jgi:hypothetical protein
MFRRFYKYGVTVSLGDCNEKVGREDIFRPAIGMVIYMKLAVIMTLW